MGAKRVVVIGGGLVGLATAFKMGKMYPDASITVLEKEAAVCMHQSGHNSGVMHTGLYYKPGSAKARLAVSGIREMTAFCQENGIPHEICGKIVVATEQEEIPRLHHLMERGTANGLEGLKWLSPEEMREIEPNVGGIAGLRVPQTGIIDYSKVCEVLVNKITAQGNCVVTNAKVDRLGRLGGAWIAETPMDVFQADVLVNCAGLQCDLVSELAGEKREVRILPFRGEYYRIKPKSWHLVRNLIYPVPDPAFPFLGVHFTRMIHGGIEAGPNAVPALAREGYRKTDVNPTDVVDTLSYVGFWRMGLKYWRMGLNEIERSFSKKLFCASLQRLIPSITMDDLEEGGSGVRAQAILPNGELASDFIFATRQNAIHVLNAPSPAATASLAIGHVVVEQAREFLL